MNITRLILSAGNTYPDEVLTKTLLPGMEPLKKNSLNPEP